MQIQRHNFVNESHLLTGENSVRTYTTKRHENRLCMTKSDYKPVSFCVHDCQIQIWANVNHNILQLLVKDWSQDTIAIIPIPKSKLTYIRKIKKRSYKNFTQKIWIEELKKKDWSVIVKENDINGKTAMYTKLVTEALDVCAPVEFC